MNQQKEIIIRRVIKHNDSMTRLVRYVIRQLRNAMPSLARKLVVYSEYGLFYAIQ